VVKYPTADQLRAKLARNGYVRFGASTISKQPLLSHSTRAGREFERWLGVSPLYLTTEQRNHEND
jgi:hypothetical protein